MHPNRTFRSAFLLFLLAASASSVAHAQAARVAAVQAVSERSSADNPAWVKAPVGTVLRTGDRLRTGKRSKADIKFTDGSLIRLGQLSTLEIRGDRDAQLAGGQLLFSFLKPGRILAGAAAAEIKGTVGIITVNDDGSVEYALYPGALDVVSALRTVHLRPGQQVHVFTSGVFGQVARTAPLEYAGGSQHPDLDVAPNSFPYVGSHADMADRDDNGQRSVQYAVTQSDGSAFGGHHHGSGVPGLPIPGGGNGGGGTGSGPQPGNGNPFPTPVNNPVPNPFPTLSGALGTPSFSGFGLHSTAFSGTRISRIPAVGTLPSGINSGRILLAAVPVASPSEARADNPEATGSLPDGTPEANLQLKSAEEHLSDADYGNGSAAGTDLRLLGSLGEDGDYAVGARFHGYVVHGHWFLDGAFTPLRVAIKFQGSRQYTNLNPVTDLTLTYRSTHGDVELGRQRFLDGPTQATLYGSMIRAGGREIMDAARLTTKLNSHDQVQAAYLFQAFPHNLAPEVPTSTTSRVHGLLFRYGHSSTVANLGLNLLDYAQTTGARVLGVTGDYAVPLLHNQLELYGEVGRDPFKRDLTSFGVYLPGVYQRTGYDVFLEWADLASSDTTPGVPKELALRIYKKVSNNADLLFTTSHFSDHTNSVILGVSIGDATHDRH